MSASLTEPNAMYVVLVRFRVAPPFVAEFRDRVLAQASNSLEREPACRRFDVAFDPEDASHCLLYELYDSREAFDAHLATQHFLDFDAAVADGVIEKEVSFWNLAASS